jgi:hypothetical protein
LLSNSPAVRADTNFIGPDGASWFQDASPNDWSASGGLNNSDTGNDNPAVGDGAGVIDTSAGGVGVVFDPVNQTPGTTSYTYSQLYLLHATASATTTQQSSKVTIDSGTMTISGSLIVGRYGNDNISGSGPAVTPTGYLVINGGSLVSQSTDLDVANAGGTPPTGDVYANGTLIFNSGSLTSNTLRVGETSFSATYGTGVGTLIDAGDGSGTISTAAFQPGAASTGSGVLVFHDGGGATNNGVTPITVSGTTKIGDVSSSVDLATLAGLSLVLDNAPVMTMTPDAGDTDYLPANIDLINSASDSGYFNTVQGTSGYTNSSTTLATAATVTAMYGGNSYSWILDYKAVVSGGVVTATTGGSDIVLLGSDSSVAVPEPVSIGLLAGGCVLMLGRRRRTSVPAA